MFLILDPRTADMATSGFGILSSKRHQDGRVTGVLRVCVMPRKLHRTSPHCWIDAASWHGLSDPPILCANARAMRSQL